MIGPAYPIDLHTHSLRSDGVHEPSELVRLAARRGVRALALSDHDTLAGVAQAVVAGEEAGLHVIPAIELNTESSWGDVHVLGYFVDPGDDRLEERLRWLRENRGRRIELMVERLNALGYKLSLARVLEIAAGGALGRPHLAAALTEAGHVASYDDAFRTLISKQSPAYVERVGLTPVEAVELIVAHGGVPALAHPGTVQGLEELLHELVERGLAGIEVYYWSHVPAFTAHLGELARSLGLIPTGGSDYHGRAEAEGPLGSVYVPEGSVAALESRMRAPAGKIA